MVIHLKLSYNPFYWRAFSIDLLIWPIWTAKILMVYLSIRKLFFLSLSLSRSCFFCCVIRSHNPSIGHIHNIGTELIKSMINRHSAPELCIFLDHVVYANFWGLNWKLGTDLIFIWVLFGGMRWTIVSICISLLCMLYF